MRLVELAAVVLVLVGVVLALRSQWLRSAPRDEWLAGHRFEEGVRRVYVTRGTEREPVGEVAPGEPDYDEAFMRLMDRARERAALLNAER